MKIKEILEHAFTYLRSLYPLTLPELVALTVGLLTLDVSVLSYRLQKKFTQQTFDLEKKRDEAAEQQRDRLEARAKRQVPDNILLGDEILIMPTMREAGIPDSLGYIGIFEQMVKKGEWVGRGDKLVTVRYRVFYNSEKPRWRFFKDEEFWVELSLRSPVSGLVISFRKEMAGAINRYAGDIVYSELELFPIILLRRKEPPPDEWEMYFYGYMNDRLRRYWRRIAYHDAYGKSERMREKFPDLEPQLDKELRLDPFNVRQLKAEDKELLSEIQRLRTNRDFPDLHTKLAHLIP